MWSTFCEIYSPNAEEKNDCKDNKVKDFNYDKSSNKNCEKELVKR